MDYPLKNIMMGELDSLIVEQIQEQLNVLGCGPIDVDGIFGRMTVNAVKTFQCRHCDLYGHPLKIDVYINPKVPHSSIEKYTTKSTMNGNFPFIKYGQYVYKTRDNNQEPS